MNPEENVNASGLTAEQPVVDTAMPQEEVTETQPMPEEVPAETPAPTEPQY